MNRRDFVRNSCIACLGGMGIATLFESCSTSQYVTNYQLVNKKITVNKSAFLSTKNEKTVKKKFILIKIDSLPFPIVLYPAENNYHALLLECTHQGCELTPYESAIVCPCHGAEFSKTGEVTQGPAEINLKSFITTHDHENIFIQL